MIKFKYLYIFLVTIFLSCETEEKFSGSPEGNLEIENINGIISTTATYALEGQEIEFTATLPQSFRGVYNDTVSVEATTTTIVGSVRKAIVEILPNKTSATGKILVGGGLGNLFDSSFTLNLSAIKLKKELPNKHFTLSSNVVNVLSGSTPIPADDDKKLTIQLTWLNNVSRNQIQLRTFRENSQAVTFNQLSSSGSANININNVNYLATFDSNLNTTISNFINLHSPVLNSLGIFLEASDSSIIINFPNNNYPTTQVNRIAPITTTTLMGSVFKDALYNPSGDQVKDFSLYKQQRVNRNGSLLVENDFYAFNPGNYIFAIGAANASQLENIINNNIKYRLVIKRPSGDVEIINGVYNNVLPTPTTGFKPVFKIAKIGSGNTSVFNLTNLNP